MKNLPTWAKWTLGMFGVLVVISIATPDSRTETTTTTVTAAAEPSATTTTTSASKKAATKPVTSPAEIEPDLECSYVLGEMGNNGFENTRFVGGGSVENTGGSDASVRVTFTWEQIGTQPIKASDVYTVKAGKSQRVAITVPATDEQLELHQAGDQNCKGTATVRKG